MALFRSIGARKDATRGTAAIEVRKDLAGLFTNPGVLPGGASPLVTGSAGWAYTVKAAPWVTSRGDSDGVHLWGNDGDITVGSSGVGGTVPGAPGAGLSRIDIIYAFHPSASENSDTVSEPTVAVAVGAAASTPLAPSLAALPGALELARNTMTSAATSTASAGNTITQSAAVARLVGTEPEADTGWLVPTFGGAFGTNSTLRYRVIGNRVHLRGRLQNTATITAGTAAGVAILPVGARPATAQQIPTATWVSGGTPPYRPTSAIGISTVGSIDTFATENTTGLICDGISFLVN